MSSLRGVEQGNSLCLTWCICDCAVYPQMVFPGAEQLYHSVSEKGGNYGNF